VHITHTDKICDLLQDTPVILLGKTPHDLIL